MIMHHTLNNSQKTILMIHPMLSSADNVKNFVANYLGDSFNFLIPDLSDHGDAVGQIYKSAALEAKAIHDYMIEHNISEIELAFGASLGGVVLFELLNYSDINFKHIFFEGVSFHKHAAMTNFILKNAFLSKHRKAVADHDLAVRKMSEIYGEKAGKVMAHSFINMNEESIINIVYDCAYVNLPLLSEEVQKKCVFAFGEKDSDLKKAKKVQPIIYPKSEMRIWKGYDHCVYMTDKPKNYADMLLSYLK